MTGWTQYEAFLLSGLWHVHTDVTDGADSIDALLTFATDQNFPLIGFTEHVRRSPTYNFFAFYDSVLEQAAEYEIECVVGCEAKVLNRQGDLDVSSDVAEQADLVYAAYHGTPFDRDEYLESVHAMLQNPAVNVWAHPFAYAVRNDFSISERTLSSILDRAATENVLLESNLRHESILSPGTHGVDIVGYDLHDCERWTGPRSPGPGEEHLSKP